jgi:hypothetical protein
MRLRPLLGIAVVAGATFVAGCGGGSATAPASPTPTATPVAILSASGMLATSTTTTTSLTLGPIGAGYGAAYGGTITAPAGNVVAHLTTTISQAAPPNFPTIQKVRRAPRDIGGGNIVPFGFITIEADVTATLQSYLGFAWYFTGSDLALDPTHSYVAFYDPSNQPAGLTTIEGPAMQSSTTISPYAFQFTWVWNGPSSPVTLQAGTMYVFMLFTTSSTLTTTTP